MNTIHSFTVSMRVLRALNRLTSIDETRFVLNGILVEVYTDKFILVATDARAMGIVKLDRPVVDGPVEEPTRFIIPRTLIESASKIFREGGSIEEDEMGQEFNVETPAPDVAIFYRDDKTVCLDGPGLDLVALAIEGKFPTWQNVVPNTPKASGIPARLNPMYLERFGKIGQDLTLAHICPLCICVHEGQDGKGNPWAFTIHIPRSEVPFLGLLMPMREQGEGCDDIPAWAKEEAK